MTNDGRLVGTLVIVIGVGIFGTFTGYLANLFLAPKKKKREPAVDVEIDVDSDAGRASPRAMAEQQASIDDIERLLRTDR